MIFWKHRKFERRNSDHGPMGGLGMLPLGYGGWRNSDQRLLECPSVRPKATNMTMPIIIPTSSAVVIISIISSAPSRQTMGRPDLISLHYIFAGMCELLHTRARAPVATLE